ncbi:hypothetical protein OH76DRAFT_288071 [Lentinus brumalis]|uniref:Uncharacterized protein n=1 Tax=Lentinus brumalis TaxID=2498619 RepID=A0A371CKK3_9APHY|nr:hypothetical protein OH76DRAFT_288071 [Polyporus brumalis]
MVPSGYERRETDVVGSGDHDLASTLGLAREVPAQACRDRLQSCGCRSICLESRRANILEHRQGDIKGTRSRTAHQQVQHVSKVVAGNGTPMSPPTSGRGLSESRRQAPHDAVRDEQAHRRKQELRTRAAPTCSGPACHELRLVRSISDAFRKVKLRSVPSSSASRSRWRYP